VVEGHNQFKSGSCAVQLLCVAAVGRSHLTGAVESEKSESVDNPMHEAAKRGNLAYLLECIANKVSVNSLDKVRHCPLVVVVVVVVGVVVGVVVVSLVFVAVGCVC
jgi:hypothetical protein